MRPSHLCLGGHIWMAAELSELCFEAGSMSAAPWLYPNDALQKIPDMHQSREMF